MDCFILSDNQKESYYEKIQKMLIESDKEFVPPLSARFSTTQTFLSSAPENTDGILAYFNEMKKQKFVVACDKGELCGFVSYIENYESSTVNELPNIYISTVIVDRHSRGKALTSAMYKKLFEEYGNAAFTRTWSTNNAHIKILSALGFEVFKILKDDRGEGIDTIYFKRRKC